MRFSADCVVSPVTELKILGSILSYDGRETCAVKHRIAQAWKCFAKWQHILVGTGNLVDKLSLWRKTVFRSLVWGLQTTKHNEHHNERLSSCQKMMVRKIMGLKRRPVFQGDTKIGIEPWVQWQIRSLQRAQTEIRTQNMDIGTLLLNERRSWAGHVARFGYGHGKVQHISKYLVAWRSRFWWEAQKVFNDWNWDILRHQWPFKPNRWEDSLPVDWMIQFSQEQLQRKHFSDNATWDPYLGNLAN